MGNVTEMHPPPAPLRSGVRQVDWLYWIAMGIVLAGTGLLITFFTQNLKQLVDFATILSFLAAPPLAIITYKVVTSNFMPEYARPRGWLKWLSWLGIIFLTGFSLLFLFWKIV